MTIVLTGGGSGGHITPILAIAHELKKLRPDVRIVYIGQKGGKLGDLLQEDKNIDAIYNVRAGKLRRYHGEGIKQVLDIVTMLKNVRDAFFVIIGFFQSLLILKKVKPNSIFIKGGYVGVPVGLAAAMLHVPYLTHDSDALPGLANRIIAKWAAIHTVALPETVYKYPLEKTMTVGVPVHENYQPVSPMLVKKYRQEIGLSNYNELILITGGGLGARRLNEAMANIMQSLLDNNPDLAVVHTVGRGNEQTMRQTYQKLLRPKDQGRVVVEGYLTDLFKYSAAADLIIARAGATNLAEFAIQQKACVVVPNPVLTGGHQLKNAAYLADQEAIEIVTEDEIRNNINILENKIQNLLGDEKLRMTLGNNLSSFARPNAASQLAKVLIQQSESVQAK